jgi:hypothetical protein
MNFKMKNVSSLQPLVIDGTICWKWNFKMRQVGRPDGTGDNIGEHDGGKLTGLGH